MIIHQLDIYLLAQLVIGFQAFPGRFTYHGNCFMV